MLNNNKKILIVDDNKELVSKINKILKGNGYDTYFAYNGSAGLSSAKSIHPDLIILDINMPVVDGIEMLKVLRREVYGARIPVIILSSLSNEIFIRYSLESAAEEYLNKNDISYEDLLAIVSKYLK